MGSKNEKSSRGNKVVCLIEDLSSGGAERQLAYLAVCLKKEGYEVHVWTYYSGNFYLPLLNETGVQYRYIPEAQNRWKRITVLRRELKKFNPDTLIAFLDTACIVACVIKALGAKFKLIVSDRNTTQELNCREKIKFYLYRYADWVVPNSVTQGNFIKAHFRYLIDKVRVITNYIDTNIFKPVEDKAKAKEDTTRVLVVARIMPQKNPINLIKTARRLKDKGIKVIIDWYGNSYDENYKKQCEKMMEELQVSDIVHFYSATSNIASIYPLYDLFCLPSKYEGFSNVICEAMSCGLPVICSNVADNTRIISEGENAISFNPFEVDDIFQAFISYLSLPQNIKNEFAKKSREIAERSFSKDMFINQYKQLI